MLKVLIDRIKWLIAFILGAKGFMFILASVYLALGIIDQYIWLGATTAVMTARTVKAMQVKAGQVNVEK